MRGLLPLVLAAAAASPAAAEVVVDDGVPFTAVDLTDALAARATDAADVHVTPAGPDEVRLATPAGTWLVTVGTARGPAAARIVALHLVAADDRAPAAPPAPLPPPAPSPPRVAAAVPSVTPPPRVAVVERAVAPPAPSIITPTPAFQPRRASVRFRAGGSGGVEAQDLTAGVLAVELATTRRGVLLATEVAFHVTEPSGGVGSTRLTFTQLRYTAGLRRGPFEFVAGPFAGLMIVRTPDRPDAFMLGLGTSVRFRYPLGGHWTGELAAGLDAHQHRLILRTAGTPIASTPRVALLTTLGLTWSLP